jgi:two-component system, chemotaxis family, chemotaxis protein CheY
VHPALPGGPERGSMKKVLVIDDSPTVREQVREALRDGCYQAIEAVDAPDAIRKLDSHKDIVLLLCDVNMPGMSGLDLLDLLTRTNRIEKIPFVLLTSEAQPTLIERARKAGARAWIVKPFRPALLLAAVRKLVGD